VVCHSIDFCKTDPGQPECHIFPKPKVTYINFDMKVSDYYFLLLKLSKVSIANRVSLLKQQKPHLYNKVNKLSDSKICNNPIPSRP
jgi:hypothetical protein